MTIHEDASGDDKQNGQEKPRTPMAMYLRFGAMIVTGMVVMYWVMFVGSWE